MTTAASSFSSRGWWIGLGTQQGWAPSRNLTFVIFHWLQGITRVYTYTPSVLLPQHNTQLEGSREVRKSQEILVALSSNQESVLMSSFCHKPCLLRPANKAPIQEGKTPPTCESHWVFKGLIWDAHIIGILGICFLPCLPKPNPGIFLKPSIMSDGKFCQQYQLDRNP